MYKILNNRIYLGDIRHRDQWYPGEHEAIIEVELFEQARTIMAEDPKKRAHDCKQQTPAPLKGLPFGPDGKAMTPTHCKNQGKLYRYYVTHTANKTGHEECPIGMVRAGDIEGIVFDQLKHVFRSPEILVRTWEATKQEDNSITQEDIRQGLQSIETIWDHLFHNEQTRLLKLFIEKIQLSPEGISIELHTNGIGSLIMDLKAEHRKRRANS